MSEEKSVITVYEQRLISIGFPFSDAVSICHSMRREQDDLERFVIEQEQAVRSSDTEYGTALPHVPFR